MHLLSVQKCRQKNHRSQKYLKFVHFTRQSTSSGKFTLLLLFGRAVVSFFFVVECIKIHNPDKLQFPLNLSGSTVLSIEESLLQSDEIFF